MSFQLLLLFISLIAIPCIGTPIPADTCGPGEYRSSSLVCLDCTEGKNFMPENDHNNSQCYNCSQIEDPQLELVHAECNKTHNTIIVCITGYYWSTDHGTCVECQSCNHTGRQCQLFSNSVCCPGDNYQVIDDVCQLWCRAGEYLSGDKCLPCKEGHFNSHQSHRDTECKVCKEPDLPNHLIIKVACNKTHDTELVCKPNYYWGKYSGGGECHICQDCSVTNEHKGRNCSNESNTVCCQKPGMIVTESNTCVENVTTTITTSTTTTPEPRTCGKGQYLDISFNDTNTSCLPCRNGTYQDLVNHTEAQCKNCTQYNGTEIQLPGTCQAQEKDIHEHSKLSGGEIIAIVVGVVIIIIIIIIICWQKKRLSQICGNDNEIGNEHEMARFDPNPTNDVNVGE